MLGVPLELPPLSPQLVPMNGNKRSRKNFRNFLLSGFMLLVSDLNFYPAIFSSSGISEIVANGLGRSFSSCDDSHFRNALLNEFFFRGIRSFLRKAFIRILRSQCIDYPHGNLNAMSRF